MVWQRLSVHLGWGCDNVRAAYDEIPKAIQDEVFASAKAFVKENKGRYDCYGYIYTGEGQDIGQFYARLAGGMARFRNLPVIQGLQNLTTAIQSLVRLMVFTLIKAAKNSLPHLQQITAAALKLWN